MKYLTQFLKFAANPFFRGKILTVTGIREWVDYDTKQKLGWIVDVVITADDTVYKHREGEIGNNLYEKLALKIESMTRPNVNIGDKVELVGEPVCTVYGEYKNLLSVRCSGVQVVSAATTTKKEAN